MCESKGLACQSTCLTECGKEAYTLSYELLCEADAAIAIRRDYMPKSFEKMLEDLKKKDVSKMSQEQRNRHFIKLDRLECVIGINNMPAGLSMEEQVEYLKKFEDGI